MGSHRCCGSGNGGFILTLGAFLLLAYAGRKKGKRGFPGDKPRRLGGHRWRFASHSATASIVFTAAGTDSYCATAKSNE